jgi:hypothetical protein
MEYINDVMKLPFIALSGSNEPCAEVYEEIALGSLKTNVLAASDGVVLTRPCRTHPPTNPTSSPHFAVSC